MSDCCAATAEESTKSLDHLVILGGGGAAFSAALTASGFGAKVTIINHGLPMGGTCVNVGCVPSKTLLRAAESLHRAATPSPFAGVSTTGSLVDFAALMRQKKALVEELREAKYAGVIADNPLIHFIDGFGVLTETGVRVGSDVISGDAILVATGTSPWVPPIPGLDSVAWLTNETLFELTELPESLTIVGGRYIALECAQMFARLGSRVTVLQRSDRILPTESTRVTDELTRHLEAEGVTILTGVTVSSVAPGDDGSIDVSIDVGNNDAHVLTTSHLLLATGRAPNTTGIGLEDVGVDRDDKGFVVVDETMRTTRPGVFAAGDVAGEPSFVYTASYEGALAAENAVRGSTRGADYTALPWVVFTDPQVAGIGFDAAQAAAAGLNAESSVCPLSSVPRSIAARDTRGFIELIRNVDTDVLLGARIVAPEGSELLMEMALALKFNATAMELAKSFHAYLTLSEGIKLAALSFGKDISKLSCCAT